jgi:coenzyme PQQ precursor peptide PqqA
MKWGTPRATEVRFGMEITMYVANRRGLTKVHPRERGRTS